MIVRRRVDLPTPLRPSTARLPRSGNSSEIPSSTIEPPYPAHTSFSASKGSAMARPAKIDLAHTRICGDFIGRTLEQDASADHYDNAAGEAKHEVHVVLDKHHCDVARKTRDDCEQFRAFVARHSSGGLVEQ